MRHELGSYIRAAASAAVNNRLQSKIGYVVSFNPKTYAVKVRLEPESTANEQVGLPLVITNWLPLLRTYGGNGWGMIAQPNADPNPPYGDMALVLWPDGGHGVVLVGFYNDVEQAFIKDGADNKPIPGEWWLVHKTGSVIKVLDDKSIHVDAASGATLNLDEGGDFHVKSNDGAIVESNGGTVNVESSAGSTIKVLDTGAIVATTAVGAQLELNVAGDFLLTSVGSALVKSTGGNVIMEAAGGAFVDCVGGDVIVHSAGHTITL